MKNLFYLDKSFDNQDAQIVIEYTKNRLNLYINGD